MRELENILLYLRGSDVMSLIIAGDVVPYNKDIKLFKDGNLKKLLKGELYDIWNNSQHKVFNLEAPLINEGIPIIKCGPNLKIDEDCIFGIKCNGVSISVSLM